MYGRELNPVTLWSFGDAFWMTLACALDLRWLLTELGLVSFVKTTRPVAHTWWCQ
jgi:hypothetical protein